MKNRINRLSSFSGYYGSSAHKNELIEKLSHICANALANQYNFEVLQSIPIATTEELENMASGGMMGENSYFSKKLREGLQKIADDINKQFQGIGRYNSDKHNNVSHEELNDVHARAMAAQHNHDVKHMLQANAMLDQRNQNQLKAEKDFLQQQSNAATYVLQSALNLDADNQQRLDAKRKQWVTQDNRGWNELQNKANMLHKAIAVDNALQGQNKALSDTLRAELRNAWNTDTITKAEREGETPVSPLPPKEYKPSPIYSNAEKQTITLSPVSFDHKAKALTSQVASSLMMPNAMFAVGFADVKNQNTLLDNMRITMFEPKDNKERGIFLSTYGSRITLSSNLHPPQGGAGADIRYAALQAALTLPTLEDQSINIDFGLLGTYGKLVFIPKNREGSQKNMLDKWLLTAYGNIQHDSGIYANTFLSYGIFKGNITTALTKNTKKANDPRTLGASVTVGQKLPTSVEGITLEPQAQLIYQRLMFGTLSDNESFKVNMGNSYQWLLRIGGRLTQNKGYAVSFYGKLNFIKAFDNEKTIQIGESFQLASMKTSLEGGLGINAHLSQNITLHADVSYQHKLKKVGVSGIYVSGGMRYRF